MFGTIALTFLVGCVVGAVVLDLARWQRQRNAAQNLLRALDAGTIYYGQAKHVGSRQDDTSETA